jgi:hypothetical protein
MSADWPVNQQSIRGMGMFQQLFDSRWQARSLLHPVLVSDASEKAGIRIGMEHFRLREPSASQVEHALPGKARSLAATS